MRSALLLIGMFVFLNGSFGQHKVADSLHMALKQERSDTGKAIILYNLSYEYQLYRPDSALMFAQQAYDLSVRKRFVKGEAWSLAQMGNAFREMGDNAQALHYYLEQLKIEEGRGYADNLASVNMTIALAYNRDRDTANAIRYILKADSIIDAEKLSDLKIYSVLNMGEIFEKSGRLKEATQYAQQAYQLARKNNDSLFIGSALNNLGNVNNKQGDYASAITNYRNSIPFLIAGADSRTITQSELGLATAYAERKQNDSAKYYALTAYRTATEKSFMQIALSAGALLSKLHKAQGNTDSAFAYQETVIQLRDSLESAERIKKVESMSIAEKLRQQHIATVQAQEKEETRQRLQLLAIGAVIPVFFLLTMYISRRTVNKRLITFLGIVSLLLLFEYITLFIHPWVQRITHHTPAFEIIIFVCIAALMIPLHHRIEHWFTKRLTKMNERYRLRKQKAQPESSEDANANTEQDTEADTALAEAVEDVLPDVAVHKKADDSEERSA